MGDIPDAILKASDHTSRLVLLALCRDSSLVTKKAEHVLNKLAARDKVPFTVKRIGGEVPLVCATCGAFYFEEENSNTACQFHDGELEEYDDAFPDTDSFFFRGMTDDEIQEEYPDEYFWNCCKKQGCADSSLGSTLMLREGCIKRRHMTSEELRNYDSSCDRKSNGSSSDSDSDGNSSTGGRKRRYKPDDSYNVGIKRQAVAGPVSAEPPKGIKVTPVPVPVLLPAATNVTVQPTVITLSDGEDDEEAEKEEEEEEDEYDDNDEY